MIDLNDLRAFEKVAATKSFASAARALGVPRSSVSRSIARLEREIDARLFSEQRVRLRWRRRARPCYCAVAASSARSKRRWRHEDGETKKLEIPARVSVNEESAITKLVANGAGIGVLSAADPR
jgi:DNA-binding transcriptional LysR family regulator